MSESSSDSSHTRDMLRTLMTPYSHRRPRIFTHVVSMISYIFRVPEDEVQECIDEECICLDVCCFWSEIHALNLALRAKTRPLKDEWFSKRWGDHEVNYEDSLVSRERKRIAKLEERVGDLESIVYLL